MLTALKETTGPFYNALHEAMRKNKVNNEKRPIKIWVGHAGSFTGISAYRILRSETLPLLLNRREFTKFGEEDVKVAEDSRFGCWERKPCACTKSRTCNPILSLRGTNQVE